MADQLGRLNTALADRYRIERELGAGGMATVYLAEDLKHKRKVALKVLRPELAAVLGAERFVQEITTTASLQHPHILPLFDSGEADSFLYYVMPYIEGETLRDKLNRETQLGIEEAVRITCDVADALDYAHRHNVIHRDIKPENILLHDGRPMVADFGIALAVSAAAGGRMTETGLSLGTPHYMSPEQATAEKDLSNRSDIYSLGAVLYEMLTGDPPHIGGTAQQIIMKIVTEEVAPVTKARKSVPPNVAAAVAKSLEKLPADRFESAAQFTGALKNPAFVLSPTRPVATPGLPAGPWKRVAIAATAMALVLLISTLWGWLRPVDSPTGGVHRQRILLGTLAPLTWPGVAPDGSAIAYVERDDRGGVWIKEREQSEATRLAGTEGAIGGAWFSPDGAWLLYAVEGGLRRVPRHGGASTTVTDSLGAAGCAWLENGSVVFASSDYQHLYRVDAHGGVPELLLDASELGNENFSVITAGPVWGTNAVLLVVSSGVQIAVDQVWTLDLATGKTTKLLDGAGTAFSLPAGYLVYGRPDGGVFAAPFDHRALEMTGPAVPLLDGLSTTFGIPLLTLAPNGTAIYQRGASLGLDRYEPVWLDRSGASVALRTEWEWAAPLYGGYAILADGQQLAFDALRPDGRRDIWRLSLLDQQPPVRLTFEGHWNRRPSWTPDGESLVFISDRGGDREAVWMRRADGSDQARRLLSRDRGIAEALISPDGEWLVYRTSDEAAGRGDILAVRLGPDSAEIALAATEAEETAPALSPDGRWLAYTSDVSGQPEIYVVPFPDAQGGRWQISTSGGAEPVWAHSGRELFYRSWDQLMAVEIVTDPQFAQAGQRPLFDAAWPTYLANSDHRLYAVTPDDQAFLFWRLLTSGYGEDDFVLVENWVEEIKDLVGN
jgi:serine/threonine-protein kinase